MMTPLLALRTTGVLAAALAALVASRRMPASTRRDLLTLAVVVALGAPALSWLPWPALPASLPSAASGFAAATLGFAGSIPQEPALSSAGGGLWGLLSWVWMCGVAAVVLRWGYGLTQAARLRAATGPVDAAWAEAVDQVTGEVAVRSHPEVVAPVCLGWFRPLIVVPATVSWSTERRVRALRHELAHARSADNLRLLLGSALCAVHWFNPLAWHLNRALRLQMEHAADAAVISSGADPLAYAGDLVALGRGLSAAHGMSLGGSDLERRVRRLASRHPVAPPRRLVVAALAAAVVAIGGVGLPAVASDVPTHAAAAVTAEVAHLVDAWDAEAVAIVVLDAASGEIVASGEHGESTSTRPWVSGSVIKPFVAVAALDAGVAVDLDTLEHWLETSSNDGFRQLAAPMDPGTLAASLRAQGLSQAQSAPTDDLALGQFPTHTLELARAYRGLGDTAHGRQVRTMLLAPVEGDAGTAGQARVAGVSVAGKTGTTILAGTEPPVTLSSFVGLVPAADPRFIIAVQVASSGDKRWGGRVSAPAFARLVGALGDH